MYQCRDAECKVKLQVLGDESTGGNVHVAFESVEREIKSLEDAKSVSLVMIMEQRNTPSVEADAKTCPKYLALSLHFSICP